MSSTVMMKNKKLIRHRCAGYATNSALYRINDGLRLVGKRGGFGILLCVGVGVCECSIVVRREHE